jgi:hypothetical protein
MLLLQQQLTTSSSQAVLVEVGVGAAVAVLADLELIHLLLFLLAAL